MTTAWAHSMQCRVRRSHRYPNLFSFRQGAALSCAATEFGIAHRFWNRHGRAIANHDEQFNRRSHHRRDGCDRRGRYGRSHNESGKYGGRTQRGHHVVVPWFHERFLSKCTFGQIRFGGRTPAESIGWLVTADYLGHERAALRDSTAGPGSRPARSNVRARSASLSGTGTSARKSRTT